MAKKRTKSLSDDRSGKRRRSNPFLAPASNEEAEEEVGDDCDRQRNEVLINHILSFSNRGKSAAKQEDVGYLVEYLENFGAVVSSTLVAPPSEVARLLLPWALQQINGSSGTTSTQAAPLAWKALVISLKLMMKDDTANLQAILTQSVLFKLVPKVAVAKDVLEPYELLLNLYQPVMDASIKTVFLPLLLDPKVDLRVLLATLKWIEGILLSRKGNPKTTFQLLANRNVLLGFSRAYRYFQEALDKGDSDDDVNDSVAQEGLDVIRAFLWDGLFHHRHHMDGFASLLLTSKADQRAKADNFLKKEATEQKKRFKLYHEELLVSIADCLFEAPAAPDDKIMREVTSFDKQDAIRILPVLLQGFFQQSQDWYRETRKKNNKTKGDSLALLQFQLFQQWGQLIEDFVADPDVSVLALRSVREMLEVVSEFDAYTPSQLDEDQHYPFLQSIAALVLEKASCKTLLLDSIRILSLLLELNHLLLHDTIVDVMSLCVTRAADKTLYEVIVSFLSKLVDTYRLLRQQSRIFLSILGVGDRFKEMPGELSFLQTLLRDQKVASAIAMAVQSCPILEVKQTFETVKGWITNQCKSIRQNSAGSFDVAVQLSRLVLRNVRVDRGTAADVASICRDFLHAVEELDEVAMSADGSHNGLELKNASLTLCGFVLDLHTRCIFWLGKNEQLELPPGIAKILENTDRDQVEQSADGFIFLACHRLRELHSHIHDQQHKEMDDEATEKTSDKLAVEATRLAASIANVANLDQRSPQGQLWIVVAQNFTFWVTYANGHDIDLFLRWLFSAFVDFTFLSISPGSSSDAETPCLAKKDEVARALLSDCSFLEHAGIASQISIVGLTVAADRLSSLLSTCKAESKLTRVIGTLSCGSEWAQSDPSDFLWLVKDCSTTKGAISEEANEQLKCARQPVLLINGMPCIPSSEKDLLKSVDLALRMDYVCRSICSNNPNLLTEAMSMVSACRLFVAKILRRHYEVVCTFIGSKSDTSSVACGMMKSAVVLLAEKSELESLEAQQLIRATGLIVDKLLHGILPMDALSAATLSSNVAAMIDIADSEVKTRVLAALSRHVLNGLYFNERPALYKSAGEDVITHLSVVVDCLRKIAHSSNRPLLEGDRKIAPRIPFDAETPLEGLLLEGDLLCTKCMPDSRQACDEILQSCVEALTRSTKQSMANASWDALCYLTGCLVQINPTSELSICIIQALSCRNSDTQRCTVLEASFCHIIPFLPQLDLNAVLVRLTATTSSEVPQFSNWRRLRLLRFLIRYIRDEQTEILACFGRQMFVVALRTLHGDDGEAHWADKILLASTLIEDLVKNRHVLQFRERDLAMVLSYVSAVLGPASNNDMNDELNHLSDMRNVAYGAVANLFSTMFQRYTKLLFACVPSVISVLHSFLCQVMYASTSLSDQAIRERGQYFARLCGLLVGHRDIYKKHIVGLVLEFVRGLELSMDVTRRECLVPAVYCLLDTMSTYETQQLNANMNTKGKMLFQMIHQSYQKIHAYRGQ